MPTYIVKNGDNLSDNANVINQIENETDLDLKNLTVDNLTVSGILTTQQPVVGTVSIDNITESATRKILTTGTQTIQGIKNFTHEPSFANGARLSGDLITVDNGVSKQVLLNREGTFNSTDTILTKYDSFYVHNSGISHICTLPSRATLVSGWTCRISNTDLNGTLQIQTGDDTEFFDLMTGEDITSTGFTLDGSKHITCTVFYTMTSHGFYITYPLSKVEEEITTLNSTVINSEDLNISDEISVTNGGGSSTWKMNLKDNVATLDSNGPTIEIIKQAVPRLTISNSSSTFQNKIIGEGGLDTSIVNIGDLSQINPTSGQINVYNKDVEPVITLNRFNSNSQITFNDVIGEIKASGYDNTDYRVGGRIYWRCDASWSNSSPSQYRAKTALEFAVEDSTENHKSDASILTLTTDEANFYTPLLTVPSITASGTITCNRLETGAINATGNLIHSGSTAHFCKDSNDPDERYIEIGSHYIDFHNGSVPASDYDGRIQQVPGELKLTCDTVNITNHDRASSQGLMLNDTLVRATATELNLLEGVTSLGGGGIVSQRFEPTTTVSNLNVNPSTSVVIYKSSVTNNVYLPSTVNLPLGTTIEFFSLESSFTVQVSSTATDSIITGVVGSLPVFAVATTIPLYQTKKLTYIGTALSTNKECWMVET